MLAGGEVLRIWDFEDRKMGARLSVSARKVTMDPRISAALEYLEVCPPGSVPSLGLLAQKFNISESYLRHRFKEQVGISFSRYVRSLRFRRARHLLSNSSMNVKQARLEVGLLDHSSFSKTYKKYFGETPTSTKRAAHEKWKLLLVRSGAGQSRPFRTSA